MIASFRNPIRAKAMPAALFLLAALICPAARGADKDKDKKPEKEKKEKIEPWVEIRTAHFIVASDGGEKTARRIADEFESLVRVFQATMPNARIGTGVPVRILAARDGQSYGRMIPESPFDKRHEQPPGIFVLGPEKTYIGIRANVGGHFPYAEIFQKYAHQILSISYRNLPPWLEEGYSTVYGNLSFTDHGIRLERPDPDDLSVLFESPLLPLEMVLKVDRTSPYYSPGNKQSVYISESRVLLHFLISDPQIAATKSMERYVTAVEGGADSLQAARDAFGDLNQLQTKLEAFVKYVNGPPAEIPLSSGGEAGGPPRTLSVAEVEARTADFLALRGRGDDAQGNLEEAIRSDPSLAEAEQSLGFLLLKKEELDDADMHFKRAAQLDPKDGLNYYGLGLVAMVKSGKGSAPVGASDAFEKSVALNPDFAPAWYNLSTIYSERDETLQKALADAQRASSLMPGDSGYQLQLADILDRLGHPDEARKAAAHVQETASDRATADKAGNLVARMSKPKSSAAAPSAPVGNTPAKAASDSGPRIVVKTEQGAPPSATSTVPAPAKAEPAPAPAPPLFSETKVYSMIGTITDVDCASATQVQITMKSLTITMKLHATEMAKVSIKSAGSDAAAKAPPCPSLRGRRVRVSYVLVLNKPWDGEMQEVEFRSEP